MTTMEMPIPFQRACLVALLAIMLTAQFGFAQAAPTAASGVEGKITSGLESYGDSSQRSIQAETTAMRARLRTRLESLGEVSAEYKPKLSTDFRQESKAHFGFSALKNVDDARTVDTSRLPVSQIRAINQTTEHVVDGNLIPISVLNGAIKPGGDQIYPELTSLIANSGPEMTALAAKVGRIRYWIKNGKDAIAMQDSDAYLAGTGFVIGEGTIATACHVLDYITDESTVTLSPNLWVKIDLSADSQTHQAYAITGVVGKGSLEGQDYAILSVSKVSEDGSHNLPGPMPLAAKVDTSKYIGVIGYPDIAGAVKACAPEGSGCDETNKWFASFASKNPGVIKIISPGRITGYPDTHKFPIITYDAPTLGGQSGSPVVDLQSKVVIGLHYCCTGYKPRSNEPTCAQLQPTSLGDKSDNEALSIGDIAIPKVEQAKR